jgi:enoyl-CoA hydratase
MAYETIEVRTEAGKVGIVKLNRPKQLNALNDQLMDELGAALTAFDADDAIGCMIVTGSEKAFAAGADIAAMAKYTFADVFRTEYISRNWETLRRIRKPVIAAVSGFALGGGCEVAMMCDFIIAADNAKFGQPEVKIGVIPGAGGTQRLPRAVGKSKALAAALTICEMPRLAVMAAKESVNRSFEGPLGDGLLFERRMFHAMFATNDQKEGMDAFLAKRPPQFKAE